MLRHSKAKATCHTVTFCACVCKIRDTDDVLPIKDITQCPCTLSNFFGGVAGSEDFACATLPTTPLDFQGKIKNFCHPTLLIIGFKIAVTPFPQKGQSQYYGASINSNGLLTLSRLLSLKFLLHMTTCFIKENHFNNCI